MEYVQTITLICSCVTGVAAVAALIVALGRKAKQPNKVQDDRLAELERRVSHHDTILERDNERLKRIEEGNRVTQRALLALLAHAIDGNNTTALKDAEQELQKYLIYK